MSNRYVVKYSTGNGNWPMHPFPSSTEALSFVKQLFAAHGEDGVEVQIDLNDSPLYGYRRLCQWNRGMVTLD